MGRQSSALGFVLRRILSCLARHRAALVGTRKHITPSVVWHFSSFIPLPTGTPNLIPLGCELLGTVKSVHFRAQVQSFNPVGVAEVVAGLPELLLGH